MGELRSEGVLQRAAYVSFIRPYRSCKRNSVCSNPLIDEESHQNRSGVIDLRRNSLVSVSTAIFCRSPGDLRKSTNKYTLSTANRVTMQYVPAFRRTKWMCPHHFATKLSLDHQFLTLGGTRTGFRMTFWFAKPDSQVSLVVWIHVKPIGSVSWRYGSVYFGSLTNRWAWISRLF